MLSRRKIPESIDVTGFFRKYVCKILLTVCYRNNLNRYNMNAAEKPAAFTFSIGKHNELQKAIIEEFAPRFAPHSECLLKN